MASSSIEVLIEGGKATAAPPLGPALGPMGVNIGQVVGDINKKTAEFKGMQVPVTVTVDSDTKEYSIKVGTPPAGELIKQEGKIPKGSGVPQRDFVGTLKIEQIIKVAKMKEDALTGKNLKQKVKEILGTCNSMGVKVEGVKAVEAIELVNQGKFDKEIAEEKTELSADELKEVEEKKKEMQKKLEEQRAQLESQAKAIREEFADKPIEDMRDAMEEAGIPEVIINKVAPMPGEKAGAKAAGSPAKPKK